MTVLRGGRSVRYGSGAVAGVIALETKRSDVPFGGSLELSGGSDESYRQRAQLRGTSQGWAWTTQFENFTSDGYRDNSRQESTSASVSLLTPEADWGQNRLTFSASRAEFEDPGPLTRAAFLENSRQSLQPDQNLEINTVTVGDQLRIELGSEWQLDLKGSGVFTNRFSDYQGRITDGDSQSFDSEAVVSYTGEEWSLEAGLRYQHSELDFELRQPFGSGESQQLADLTRETWGAFAIVQWKPSEELTLSAGASWDYYRLDGDARDPNNETNPRRNFSDDSNDNDYALEFGIEYQVTDRLKVWGRYDRSLRFPVLDEVAFFQGFESDQPFNADLRPERGQGVELGAILQEEDQWKVKGTLFGQWLQDEIFFDAFSNQNENLSDTERLGVELELAWEAERWSFNLFYTQILARFQSGVDEGEGIPLVPRHSLSGTFTWHATEAIDLGLEGSYLTSRDDGNDRGELGQFIQFDKIPARTVWNLSAQWKARENLSVFLRVNNLFDEEYISTQFSGGIYPGAGRQALFGGRYQF